MEEPLYRKRTFASIAIMAAAVITLSGCAGSQAPDGDTEAATATSAEDFGGLDALIEAAQAEGQLNVIALPDNWANYGEIKALFEEKYGITVNSADQTFPVPRRSPPRTTLPARTPLPTSSTLAPRSPLTASTTSRRTR